MLDTILSNTLAVVTVLLLFGVTIFVHELGHFLVARWCGLQVDTFSIGFGPALWKRTYRGVVYKIGLLPLGGYVALPQMDPSGEGAKGDEGAPRNLPRVAVWKRVLVALAGVTGNLILAFIVAHIVYAGGKSFAPPEGRVELGYVYTNSAAFEAGLRIGDAIEQVNGQPVSSWEGFVLTAALQPEPVLAVRGLDGAVREVRPATAELMGTRYVDGILPRNYPYVLQTIPGSAAERAGLQSGDRLISFNGVELFSREHLTELVTARGSAETALVYLRDGREIATRLTPAYDEEHGRALIGVLFNQLDVKKPMDQIKSHAMLVVRLLQALVTPGEAKAAAGAVGGPVAIFGMFWLYVKASFIMALWFTCLLNVNLAVLNLLPIPVLDGGHIMLCLWEGVTRRPVSPKIIGFIWNASTVLLLALFLTLTWRDVKRFIAPRATPPAVEASTNDVPVEAIP